METGRIAELEKVTQSNLLAFINTELDLSQTFLDIAEKHQDLNHRRSLLDKVQTAIAAIEHFCARVGDSGLREQIMRSADALKARCAAVQNTLSGDVDRSA